MANQNSSRRVIEIDLQQSVARPSQSLTKSEMQNLLKKIPQDEIIPPNAKKTNSLKFQRQKRRQWLDTIARLRHKSRYPENRAVRLHTRSYGSFATRLMWLSLFLAAVSIFSIDRWEQRENRVSEPLERNINR